MFTSQSHVRRGFTLVELLVVIAIIGILIGLLLPAVQAAREAARRMQCTNNVKQLALAMQNYHDVQGAFPPASWTGSGRTLETTWARMILPFIEQNALYEGIPYKPNVAYYASAGKSNDDYFCKKRVNAYMCPSDSPKFYKNNSNGWCLHNYVVCIGKTGMSQWNSGGSATAINGWRERVQYGTRVVTYKEALFRNGGPSGYQMKCQTIASCVDGTSNTMAISELKTVDKDLDLNKTAIADERGNVWYPWGCHYSAFFTPNTSEMDYLGCNANRCANVTYAPGTQKTLDAEAIVSARSWHSGGVNVGMADGSVRFVPNTISLDVWAAMSTCAGGETISLN